MLAFVVSSMLAVGVSLAVHQILAPLRNYKLLFCIVGKFCPDASGSLGHRKTA
jgi:hypothetical protein